MYVIAEGWWHEMGSEWMLKKNGYVSPLHKWNNMVV